MGEVSLLSVIGCHDVFEIFIHHYYSTRLPLLFAINISNVKRTHTHQKKDQSSKFQPWTFHSHSRKMGLMRSKKKLLWEREREILALLVRVVLSTSSTIQLCQLCILFCPRIHTAISSKKNPYSYLTLFNFCFSIFFFFFG